MIGSLITRVLLLVFGYAYPAYECYKSVEMNKPDIVELRFWCQYWILVAGLTVCERIGDMFIGWVPMYGEAKLAFFIYLWFPKTKGTTYVYDSFFRPYVAKHETEIDRSLLELRTRAGDMALLYWQKAASYTQTRIFDVLQYVASQSATPRPRPPAPPPQLDSGEQKTIEQSDHRSTATTQLRDKQLSSAASSKSSSDPQDDATNDEGASEDSKTVPSPSTLNKNKAAMTLAIVDSIKASSSNEQQVLLSGSTSSEANGNAQPPPNNTNTINEEGQRVTRARLRKARTPI